MNLTLPLTALLLGCLASDGVAAEIDIQPMAGSAQVGVPLRMTLSGVWSFGCTPEVRAERLVEPDLVITVAARAGDCSDEPVAFRLATGNAEQGVHAPQRQGIVRVRVERLVAGEDPQMLAFRLVEIGHLTRRLPETGFWWNERGGEFDAAGPGLAVLLEPQWPLLGASLMGYDAAGQPQWLFGAGAMGARSAQIPLLHLSGGRGPFEPYRQPHVSEPYATLWLEFASAGRATAWFVRPQADGIELQALSLVRFRFGEAALPAWSGHWLVDGLEETPQALRLRPSSEPESGFTLIEDRLRLRLVCELDPALPNSPPRRCRLLDAEDSVLADFEDIALDRMHGRGRDDRPVSALRLPR